MNKKAGKQALDPMAVVRASSAYWSSRVLHTAHRLDLFTRLSGRWAAVEDLTVESGADPRGLEVILVACTALGFLRTHRARYTTTPLSETFLVKGRPRYQGGIVAMFDDWYLPWGELHKAVMTGYPAVAKPHEQSEEEVRNYIMGMHYRGIAQAELLARKISLKGRRLLLDVAGGPGTFSAILCRENPGLSAHVFDLPQTLKIARGIISGYKMADRVTTREGNYLRDGFGSGQYDAVLLSSMLNQEGPEVIRQLLAKSASALKKEGLLIVQEQLLNREKSGPLLAALIGVNQVIHTPAGRAYGSGEIEQWVKEAGFRRVRFVPMPPPSPFTVLRGIKC